MSCLYLSRWHYFTLPMDKLQVDLFAAHLSRFFQRVAVCGVGCWVPATGGAGVLSGVGHKAGSAVGTRRRNPSGLLAL